MCQYIIKAIKYKYWLKFQNNVPVYNIPEKSKNRVIVRNDKVNNSRFNKNLQNKYRDFSQDIYFHKNMFSTINGNEQLKDR